MRQRWMRAAVRSAMAVPWFVRFAGRKRATGRDAGLDPQVAAALEFERIARLPALESLEPAAARRYAEAGMSPLDFDPIPMAEVIETTIASNGTTVPVRIFVPHEAGPHWLIYFHGGGGVIGSIAGSEPTTRYLAAHTRCTVASVGYRLGPEHKHPAGIEDCCAAWQALVPRATGKVAVGGDSQGGFLAAHVEHWARARGVRAPDVQWLIYPLVDLTLTSPSLDRLGDGYLLTRTMIQYFHDHYVAPDTDLEAGSPWFWTDLHGTAPAIVATAGFDPLVDEGDAWAERLRAAGTVVRHRRYPALIHGFLSLGGAVDAARDAFDELCRDLVEMLGE
ncbi:MAG: alpha/beta hydrolase [Kofleriaceae bacterium]